MKFTRDLIKPNVKFRFKKGTVIYTIEEVYALSFNISWHDTKRKQKMSYNIDTFKRFYEEKEIIIFNHSNLYEIY